MYFWDAKTLSGLWDSGELSEFQKFLHYFGVLVLTLAQNYWRAFTEPSIIDSSTDLSEAAAWILPYVVIFLGGWWLCFKTFQRTGRQQFIEYAWVVSLPISLRVLAISVAVFTFRIFSKIPSTMNPIFDLISAYGWPLLFFVLLRNEIEALDDRTA